MTVNGVARKCSRCGYFEPGSDDPPAIAITCPRHLRDRRMVHEYVRSLGQETREWLIALFVDAHLNLLAVDTIARGDVSGVDVNISAILCRGHAFKAKGFILVHNHPSGDPRPSESDVRVTSRLRWLSHELDIPLLDHCIVAADEIVTIGGI